MLEDLLSKDTSIVALVADKGKRSFTNAIFLLGAYMIIMKDQKAIEVSQSVHWLEEEFHGTRTEDFRYATLSEPNLGLTLFDTWAGLEKGVKLGWV